MMFYNYIGNVIYGSMMGAVLIIIIDRPIYSLFNVKQYAKLAEAKYDITAAKETLTIFMLNSDS